MPSLGVSKCYRCGEPGHRSNECLKRRPVNMADYKDEDELLIEAELEDFDFVEEEGLVATCVVHWLLCNQKNPGTTQRHKTFYSRCLIMNKVCNLIIDNGSWKNIISTILMNYLKLETERHPHPYTIGWIKKGPCIKVTSLCHVPIQLANFTKSQFLVMLLIYGCMSHIIGASMATWCQCYPSRQEEHIHVHLEGQEDCHEANIFTTKVD